MEINYVRCVPDNIELPEILFKYREVNKNSLSLLLCNHVYFSRPQDFNDPFEPAKKFENSPFGQILEKTVNESGIFCLCSEPGNLAMWSYYASALKGFAIGYKTSELLASVASERWKEVYKVNYENPEISVIDTQQISKTQYQYIDPEKIKMFSNKASIFSHECEIRIVIEPDPSFRSVGYGLYPHSPNAISEIIFGELIPESDETLIRQALNGRDVVFKKAIRARDKYEIEIR